MRSGRITQSRGIDLGYACFQEKYCRVCIARVAVNVRIPTLSTCSLQLQLLLRLELS